LPSFFTVAGANAAQAERLSVKANIANIRSGPNTSDAVIWQVEKYHPLNVLKKKRQLVPVRGFRR
jgi:SH3-like domain-containing protein